MPKIVHTCDDCGKYLWDGREPTGLPLLCDQCDKKTMPTNQSPVGSTPPPAPEEKGFAELLKENLDLCVKVAGMELKIARIEGEKEELKDALKDAIKWISDLANRDSDKLRDIVEKSPRMKRLRTLAKHTTSLPTKDNG